MPSDKSPITLAEDGRDLWAQQPRETDVHFAKFSAWLTLGGRTGKRRRLSDLAEQTDAKLSYLQQLSHRFHWKERTTAFDQHMRELDAEKMAEERAKMVERYSGLNWALFAKLVDWARSLDASSLSVTEGTRLYGEVFKVMRTLLGDPDHTVAVQGVPGGSPIALTVPADETERLAELRATVAQLVPDGIALDQLDPADLEEPDGAQRG